MPPTLSTSWDDSASSVEIDDYGDVFCTTLSSFDAFWSPVGLFWLPGDAEYKGLGAGYKGPWAPKEVSGGFGSDLGRPWEALRPKASKSTSQGTKMDPILKLFGETLWFYGF